MALASDSSTFARGGLLPRTRAEVSHHVNVLTQDATIMKERALTENGIGMLKRLVGSGDRIGFFALAVSLLVLPSGGLLLDTWLGVPLGLALYVGSRLFSPDEERTLAATFGASWNDYLKRVKLPWS